MAFKIVTTNHFVKNEDLNHHGTLFAGRAAEWFVEAGLMSAAIHLPVQNIVCVKIHGMNFSRPIHLGETVRFDSRAVSAGKTSLISNIAGAGSTGLAVLLPHYYVREYAAYIKELSMGHFAQ